MMETPITEMAEAAHAQLKHNGLEMQMIPQHVPQSEETATSKGNLNSHFIEMKNEMTAMETVMMDVPPFVQ
jgi:hypothetical protein